MTEPVTPPNSEHGEDVAWLEQRLDRLENQSTSLTTLLNTLAEKLDHQSLTITPEQFQTLQSLMETTTGKTSDKLQAILDKLEVAPPTPTPTPQPNPGNGGGVDPIDPSPAPQPVPTPTPQPARRLLRPI